MTARSRCALVIGLVPARSSFPLGGSQGVARWNGVARWAGVEARSGVPASSVADWEGVRR